MMNIKHSNNDPLPADWRTLAMHRGRVLSGSVAELAIFALVAVLTDLWVASALAIWMMAGDAVCVRKIVVPTPLPAGLDIAWGLKYFYWRLWWPYYLRHQNSTGE